MFLSFVFVHLRVKITQMKKVLYTLLFALAIIATGCGNRKDKIESEPHWFRHYTVYNTKEYQEHLSKVFDTIQLKTPFANYIKDYYQARAFQPIWTLNGLQEHKVDSLLDFLSKSYEHGIVPDYFHYSAIRSNIDSLKNHKVRNNKSLYDYLTNLEIEISNAYMQYARTLHFGGCDPKVVNGGKWLYQNQEPDSTFYCVMIAKSESLVKTLHELQPSKSEYKRLQREMARLYPIKDTTFKEIPQFSAKLGQQNTNLKTISQRLKITGELSASYRDTTLFTQKLLDAINLFRTNNSIPTCDSLDKETIEKLNRPISYYTGKLAANLERLRWRVIPEKDENYIAVNLPDFTLQAFLEGKMVFKTKVCCGKTQNPANIPARHHNGLVTAFKAETPLLHSEINTIYLNPEWSVPYDIIKNEYYAKLCRSNTACIRRERMYIKDVRNGRYVIPDSIDWTKVSQNNIPYRLIQSSGRHNALGQIKFSFPNSESVYLHDTNNKGAFNSRKRTFSHGCVRVQNPFELAAVIYQLNNYDSLRTEQYDILVGKEPVTEEGKKFKEKLDKQDSIRESKLTDAERPFYRKLRPTAISLKEKMPVYIEYYTCFVGENNKIHYREDMYYKDDNILTLLKYN